MTNGKLILIRHGESEFNAKGIWTGQQDAKLTDKGKADAKLMGEAIKDLRIDCGFISGLIRTHQTLENVLEGHGETELPHTAHAELNERHYGSLTGKNKWQVKEEIGEEAFHGIRRGWDYPVPEGETLKDVYDRCVPFYQNHILPRLLEGKNVVVVSHGNTIRALMKYLESIHESDIADVEMLFGQVVIYDVDEHGKSLHKEIRTVDIAPTHA